MVIGVDKGCTDGPPVIGVVHVSLESEFLYQDIRYQSSPDSFAKQLERLASSRGVAAEQVEGGLVYGSVHSAIARILARADGLLSFQHDQFVISEILGNTKNAPTAIVVRGIRSPTQSQVPYVGFDEYDLSYSLGREAAEAFLAQDACAGTPTITIVNNRSAGPLRPRDKGFESGVRSALPEAQFPDRFEDDGTVEGTHSTLEAYLQAGEAVVVVFGTKDFRARGAVLAIEAQDADSWPVVAGVGGPVDAMRELLDPDGPWNAEVAIDVERDAEAAFDTVLSPMETVGDGQSGPGKGGSLSA